MTTIFENQAGILVASSQRSGVQKKISAFWDNSQDVSTSILGNSSPTGRFSNRRSVSSSVVLLTGLDISESVFTTVSYAADNDLYLNVGGDKLGSMVLLGMLYTDCTGHESGLSWMLGQYQDFRTSARNDKFMQSQTGPQTAGDPAAWSITTQHLPPVIAVQPDPSGPMLKGLLHSHSISVADPGGPVFSFRLNTHLLPRD